MCGRYSLTRPIKTIAEHFGLKTIAWDSPPRFNVAPTQVLPVVASGEAGWTLRPMRWGLVPHWAKEAGIGQRMINARAETVAEKPSFRTAFKTHRCLIPCDGFYEWRAGEDGKFPHYIRMKSEGLFAFAGLWAEWTRGETPLVTFTIITTGANRWLQPLHDRMPVILLPDQYASWMQPDAQPDQLHALLQPLPQDLLEFYPVSKTVNSPKNDGPECTRPAA